MNEIFEGNADEVAYVKRIGGEVTGDGQLGQEAIEELKVQQEYYAKKIDVQAGEAPEDVVKMTKEQESRRLYSPSRIQK